MHWYDIEPEPKWDNAVNYQSAAPYGLLTLSLALPPDSVKLSYMLHVPDINKLWNIL